MEKPMNDLRMEEVFEDVKKNGSENYLLLVHPDDYDNLVLATRMTGHDKIQYFRSPAAKRGKITVIAKQALGKEDPNLFDLWREELEEREKKLMEADDDKS